MRFLIAGSGTAEAELKAQAKRLGLMEHGSFVGWTGDDELHSLYRIADLCLVPSIYEPFGLVALEAMASGCPCIVADTGGLREVVPGGRRVGLRFRARDSRALGRMAEQILTDDALRDRLVAEAGEHVLRFDWADVARQTAEVYARSRRRRHHRVGADRRAVGDASRPPQRRVRADPGAAPIAHRPRGDRLLAQRRLDVAPGRRPASETIAQSPSVAPAPTVTRSTRDDHRALAEPRARADLDRPARRLDAAALAERAAVAEPHRAARRDQHPGAAPDGHARARPAGARGRAGAQPREPQARERRAARAAGRRRRRRSARGGHPIDDRRRRSGRRRRCRSRACDAPGLIRISLVALLAAASLLLASIAVSAPAAQAKSARPQAGCVRRRRPAPVAAARCRRVRKAPKALEAVARRRPPSPPPPASGWSTVMEG